MRTQLEIAHYSDEFFPVDSNNSRPKSESHFCQFCSLRLHFAEGCPDIRANFSGLCESPRLAPKYGTQDHDKLLAILTLLQPRREADEIKEFSKSILEVMTQSKTAREFIDRLKEVFAEYLTLKTKMASSGSAKLVKMIEDLEKVHKDVQDHQDIYDRARFTTLAISFGVPNVFEDPTGRSNGNGAGASSFRHTFCRLLAVEMGLLTPKK